MSKRCGRCKKTHSTPHKQCASCRARLAEYYRYFRETRKAIKECDDLEPEDELKVTGAACRTCINGRFNPHSESKWECQADKARACNPYLQARFHQEREGVA